MGAIPKKSDSSLRVVSDGLAGPEKPERHDRLILVKKGDLLFSEGEKSRSMFLLKRGAVRLFMRRGNTDVEIETVRSGQILGELAFLDGNPRSVSGEALMDCELMEISGST